MNAMVRFTHSYSTMSNIFLNSNGNTDYCIQIDNCSRIELYKVEATAALYDGIYIDNGTGTATNAHKIVQCISGSNGRHGLYIGNDQTDVWVSRCTIRQNVEAGIALDASGNQFDHNHVWGNDIGYFLSPSHAASRNVINGDYVEDNVVAEIYHGPYGAYHPTSVYDLSIVNCMFWNASHDLKNGTDGSLVYLNPPAADPAAIPPTTNKYSSRIIITGCIFNSSYLVANVETPYTDYGLYLGPRAINGVYTNNSFYNAALGGIYLGGASQTINHNEGFKTEAHGNATILTGQTHVHIPHGLPYIPALADFNVNLVEQQHVADNGIAWLSLDGTGDTNFIVYQRQVEAEDISIVWHYIRTPF
jgi:hypothetical protein